MYLVLVEVFVDVLFGSNSEMKWLDCGWRMTDASEFFSASLRICFDILACVYGSEVSEKSRKLFQIF